MMTDFTADGFAPFAAMKSLLSVDALARLLETAYGLSGVRC